MKHLFATLIVLLMGSLSASGQSLHGDWEGVLSLPMGSLKLVLHIDLEGTSPSITLDSPQQGAYKIPTKIEQLEAQALSIAIPQLTMTYQATLTSEGTLQGTFQQGGVKLPLSFTRALPQAPTASGPHPQSGEEVEFMSADGKTLLSGTYLAPEHAPQETAILLIAGSGALNRDEEIMGHRPFAVLSDSLLRAGFATLRYDKRGVAKSKGDIKTATFDDFVSDALGGVAYLKHRGYKRIILAGHSEGGMISARIAHLTPQDITAILLLNAPIKPAKEVLIEQNEDLGSISGMTAEQLAKAKRLNRELYELSADPLVSDEAFAQRALEHLEAFLPPSLQGEQREQVKRQMVTEMLYPSVRTMLRVVPLDDLRQVRCPILALQSEQDMQVSPSNADVLQEAIPTAHIRRVPHTNHLMQPSSTGLPTEYASIKTTLAPNAWQAILELLSLVP